jgi:SpoIID/LytB domain protein
MTFKVSGGYRLELPDGKGRIQRVTKKRIWRVQRQESSSAKFAFSLKLDEFSCEDEAQLQLNELTELGYETRIHTLGRKLEFGKFVHDNRRYQVIVGCCGSEEEIEDLQQELKQYQTEVFRERIEEPTGRFEIFDLEYDKHTMVDNVARLIPETPESRLTLLKTQVVSGNSRVEREDLDFSGVIEFRVENGGLMLAINEVELDEYVLSVLAAEQDGDYPREALKAKAIAVRSLALAELSLQHPWDDYDFCANDHCQRYRGVTTIHDLQEKAVSMTRGRVMLYEKQVAHTWYTTVCGGHLERGVNIFAVPEVKYLPGMADKSDNARRRNRVDLTIETNACEWIKSEPSTFCNVTQRKSQQVYEQSRRYYRWQEAYQRRELEDVITRRTGVEIGTLYEIIPIRRGVSGRILELEIIGSRNNVMVAGDSEIRRVLSNSELLSSCFFIEVEHTDLNEPLNFIIHGAGHGHGVGMCETGAGTLAVEKGFKFKEILEHYYTGIELKKIYS